MTLSRSEPASHDGTTVAPVRIDVCVCTFRRPAMLRRLLADLERQRSDDRFTLSVVVADNDSRESARSVVAEFAVNSSVSVTYCSEPRQNISLARNRALAEASGDYVALIDDDEFPAPEWLLRMLTTCEERGVAGVLGPVRPHFESPPPRWIVAGRFYERPEHPTGRVMRWEETRTGNVLFRREILDGVAEPFKPEFGSGGEDQNFFMRMTRHGHVFCWCNEGVVYETVPPERWKRRYMLKRALLRGRNVLKHRSGRARLLATSAVAVPVYSAALLPALFVGQHQFMKYSVRLCDHLGRLLAFVGVNPVNTR